MITERSDDRFAFETKCWLTIKDIKYNCLIEDLSTTGALIQMTNPDQDQIEVGEPGTLIVLLLTSVEYACKVVRKDSTQIGLQFTNI